MDSGEMLYYGGIAVMCGSVGLAALFTLIFTITGKRLNRKLNEEYGEKPRR